MTYVELPSGTVLETNDASLWPEAKRLSAKEGKRRLKAEALTTLREILKPNDTVYCVLRHVSRSGMYRRIDLYAFRRRKGDRRAVDKIYLSGHAARALDRSWDDNGIKIDGCGMDMGFALVYELGATLWPKGTRKPHGTRNGAPDCDGGYALKHEWI